MQFFIHCNFFCQEYNRFCQAPHPPFFRKICLEVHSPSPSRKEGTAHYAAVPTQHCNTQHSVVNTQILKLEMGYSRKNPNREG